MGDIKKILTFGHIPVYVGGKQHSGLANVMWCLANSMNASRGKFEVVFAATDINVLNTKIENTRIFGWTKASLVVFLLKKPQWALYYFFKSVKLFFKYRFKFFNIYFKLIFYHLAIHEEKPDFIHVHGCTAIVFFEIFGIDKYRVFATIHGLSGQDKSISGYKNYRKMELNMAKHPFLIVVFVTSRVRSQWRSFYGAFSWTTSVILNAYDTKKFFFDDLRCDYRKNNKQITLLTIASVSQLKGQRRVLEAMKALSGRIDIKYICVGGGEDELVHNLSEFALKEEINFEYLGFQKPENVRKILETVDYMILPSSSEGFGLVFLESIACGIPVILPKKLPIAQEENLLSEKNSIFMEDESCDAILNTLMSLERYSFDRKSVAESISNINWATTASQYLSLLE